MTAETTGGQGQAPATGSPQQGQAPAAPQDQQSQGQAPGTDQQLTHETPLDQLPEGVRAYVARLRQENGSYRTKAGTLEQQVQEYQRANETAEQAAQRQAQEAQERLAQLEQENRTLKVTTAVSAAAATAGAHDPALVAQLLDADVQTDEQGRPVNVAEALAALKAARPFLFRREQNGADAGAGADSGAAPAGGVSINDQLRGARRGVVPR